LVDAHADSRVALPSDESAYDPYHASIKPDAIPELYDIPIVMVNSVLYHVALCCAAAKARAGCEKQQQQQQPGE